MVEQDAGRKAHRKFAASSAIETGLSEINDPKEGARPRLTDHRPYAWRSFTWSKTASPGSERWPAAIGSITHSGRRPASRLVGLRPSGSPVQWGMKLGSDRSHVRRFK
jgi:hypothetical protein